MTFLGFLLLKKHGILEILYLSFFNRVCDSTECTRQSTFWRVFRGCGHSFHIECNLPDLSLCQICKGLLSSKVGSLGRTANEAVHQFDPTGVQGSDENSSDEDEISDTDEGDEQFHEAHEMTNTRSVLELIHKVNAWSRVEGPES